MGHVSSQRSSSGVKAGHRSICASQNASTVPTSFQYAGAPSWLGHSFRQIGGPWLCQFSTICGIRSLPKSFVEFGSCASFCKQSSRKYGPVKHIDTHRRQRHTSGVFWCAGRIRWFFKKAGNAPVFDRWPLLQMRRHLRAARSGTRPSRLLDFRRAAAA